MLRSIDIFRGACVLTVAAASGCNSSPAPPVKTAAVPSVAQAETVVPEVSPPPAPDVASPWSATPPFDRGPVFAMTRDEDVVTAKKGAVEFTLGPVSLGECVSGVPELVAPAALPDGNVTESPVWLQLQAEDAAASLLLNTRQALLFVDDGCLRFANVTSSMLANVDDEDALFTPTVLAPDDASQSEHFRFASGVVTRDGKPLLTVEPLLDETMYEALDYEGASYLRVSTSTGEDADRGYEVTHDFLVPDDASPPTLRLRSELHYVGEESERGELRISVTRAVGPWHVAATRVSLFDALNIGAGRCPQMEGALAYRATTDEVRWRVGTHDLGTARSDVLWSSGCVEEARREVRSRGRVTGKSTPEVSWSAAP